MRYHDTGGQDPAHALAKWLKDALTEGFNELRIQSGYFQSNALGAILDALNAAGKGNLLTHILVGANDCETLHSDIRKLIIRMQLPRANAKLGVVAFSGALFHPKVYYVRRADGSQTAFVGSANFTVPALSGRNVEAALSLDTANGDPVDILNEIAHNIDQWFSEPSRDGFFAIKSEADADELLEKGILAAVRARAPRQADPAGSLGPKLGKRNVLVTIPTPPEDEQESGKEEENELEPVEPSEPGGLIGNVATGAANEKASAPTKEEVESTVLPCENVDGFPDYFLFAPDATTETVGFEALTGLPLSNVAVGLIMQLKRSNARKFTGAVGTADINIPIALAKTIRFGRAGVHNRPCAKVSLRLRFIGDSEAADTQVTVQGFIQTRIQGYGYTKSETGHADIRMTMPNAVKNLSDIIRGQGLELPVSGDFFLLEWPGEGADCFGLTFIARGSQAEQTARQLFGAAESSKQLIGGACLLPSGAFPDWPDAML